MRKPMPFGKYLLLDRIAVGGMAEVFAAKTFGVEGFERTVAIKRILPTMVEDEEFIDMFKDEARIASLLNHANIVQIYELGKHDDTFFITMEYISGRDVRALIEKFRKRQMAMPIPLACYVTARIAEGLDHLHRKKDADGHHLGIIHRDVSPQNVLVSYEGDVKIIDLGIAKAAGRLQKTQAGILKGKFGYMSPEQVRGIPIDHRSDIFSLGVMLYEMLTGAKLFTGESDFSTLEKVRAGEVRAPSELNEAISPELERVVMKALAKDRDQRYQWGSELHDDLMRFLYASQVEIYSTQKLASFMKETFPEEFRKEQERLRRWSTTVPEETLDFEQTKSSPPVPVPSRVRQSVPPPVSGEWGPDGRARMGPPSAFMTSELRLEDRTSVHGAYDGDETLPPVPARSAPPVPYGNGKSKLPEPVTEAISLEDIERIATNSPVPKKKKKHVIRDTVAPAAADERTNPGVLPDDVAAPLPPPLEEEETRAARPVAAPPPPKASVPPPPPADVPRTPSRLVVAGIAGVVAVVAMGLVLFGGELRRRVFGASEGSLYVEVVPKKDVEIAIDGRLVSTTSPVSQRFPVGAHVVAVSAKGFAAYEERVEIAGGKTAKVSVTLRPLEEPAPAPTPADDAPTAAGTPRSEEGKAPKVAPAPEPKVTPDPKVVKAPAGGSKVEIVANPHANANTPVPVPVEPPKPPEPAGPPGGLMVFSNPAGAEVFVDGVSKGKTPASLDGLPSARDLKIKATLDGYKPVETQARAKVGGRTMVRLTLEAQAAAAPVKAEGGSAGGTTPAVAAGTVKIVAACTPVSKVLVDGKETDRWTPIPPANPLVIPAGKHVLSCVTADGARKDREVVLEAGTVYRFIETVK